MLACLGIPLVLLVTGEGILRLTGYGYSARFFKKKVIQSQPTWSNNHDFGRRFFPPGLVRYAQPLSFSAAKPANSLRIFVLGESAAMGDPDFKFGFARMLEVLLRQQFPNRHIEAINTAMVAINSHVILPIARDCARQQGDLWVIYMGNNEIIGPYGSASIFGARAPALGLVRASLALKETRLGQLIDASLHWLRQGNRPLPEWAGMEMMADQKIRHDSPATQAVYGHFQRNLADLLATGAKAGVPMVLCTVATNLKDCAPFASLHRADLNPEDLARWQAAFDAGAGCQEKGRPADALMSYGIAERIDDQFAELPFRQGQCCRLLGRTAEAATFFGRACDRDALQFRADGRVNDLIRQAAASFALRHVTLVDAEKLFATNSPEASVGADYFYEHVHLTPEGNYLLARAVADQAAAALGLSPKEAWVSREECLRLLGFTDWNRYDAWNVIRDRLQSAPFTAQLDHGRQLHWIDEQLARYRLATKPAQVKLEAAQVAQAIATNPEDPDLRWNLAALLESAGDTAGAEEQWRAVLKLQPESALAAFNLAQMLQGHQRQADAVAFYSYCVGLSPDYYPAQYALGSLLLKMDRLSDAIQPLKAAVGQKPGFIEARLALGQALARARHLAQAQKQFEEILRLDPNNQPARAQLQSLRAAGD